MTKISDFTTVELEAELERRRTRQRRRGGHYRGENIPTVADYAHWNEDAERIWYEENRYDMEHADEWIPDDD